MQENSDRHARMARSRLPVVLSVLVLPGSGQMVQKRWVIGVLYLSCFLASVVPMMFAATTILEFYYQDMLNPEWKGYVEHGRLSWLVFRAMVFQVLALVIYILNVFDVVVARRRAMAQAFNS